MNARDIVVIGAGAAGLMAARFAALEAPAGVTVHLVESTPDGGRKILISGGGRCNVLPGTFRPERYVTDSSPNLLRRMLRSWPLEEQRAFFTHELGLDLQLEPETGKLFPVSGKARDVRDALVAAARNAGCQMHFGVRVTAIEPGWRVHLADGRVLDAARVIIATGGLSVPATGSDGAGLRWAEALGHTVHSTYPALTPLTLNPPRHADLAGVSLSVTLRAPGARPRFETHDGFLFTHRGYSGPSVLDASHLAIRSHTAGAHQALEVQWTELDAEAWNERLQSARAGTVGGVLGDALPNRLAHRLAEDAGGAWDQPLVRLPREQRLALVRALTAWPVPWSGDEGYKKAEVMGGGVALGEVDPLTLESRIRPGLHLCGEVLDAFGPIGGHNFLWAWTTGRGAGLGAARALAK